ncbi:uncharacterized protein LOC129230528 [Uloborus diversus]|uniref:uncharacterized protein LOC129230528 n=2 Tax=Uloborus diversus TaxID=327109 RepID=UPI0024098C5F|nr:uncharacterized protein LOC129230528 [Uloborus diversus]
MNKNKAQLTYFTSFAEFNNMLADPTKNVNDVFFPTEEICAVHWGMNENFVKQDTSTNIFLAAFTTAWARMKLYQEMDKLGESVLYHDTDSIIYASNGTNDPALGNLLGEFTDELNGDTIETFVSGGPKNYGYKTASGKTCCKVRGFTLNFRNSKSLNYDALKWLVSGMSDDTIALNNPSKITRDPKKRRIINKPETKLYRMVYNKRVIQQDFTTLPYGYW